MSVTRHPIESENLDSMFVFHAPKGDQAERYGEIRAAARELAAFISERCPKSRELSMALSHVDEAVFCANAAIARNE